LKANTRDTQHQQRHQQQQEAHEVESGANLDWERTGSQSPRRAPSQQQRVNVKKKKKKKKEDERAATVPLPGKS